MNVESVLHVFDFDLGSTHTCVYVHMCATDCGTAPVTPTDVRPIILWGVSKLKDATAVHPSDDLAPPSEGGGADWRNLSQLLSKFIWMETVVAGVSPSLTDVARSSCRRGSKGSVDAPFPSSSSWTSIFHVNENYFGHARLEKVP